MYVCMYIHTQTYRNLSTCACMSLSLAVALLLYLSPSTSFCFSLSLSLSLSLSPFFSLEFTVDEVMVNKHLTQADIEIEKSRQEMTSMKEVSWDSGGTCCHVPFAADQKAQFSGSEYGQIRSRSKSTPGELLFRLCQQGPRHAREAPSTSECLRATVLSHHLESTRSAPSKSALEVIDDKSLVVAMDDSQPPQPTPLDADGRPLQPRLGLMPVWGHQVRLGPHYAGIDGPDMSGT